MSLAMWTTRTSATAGEPFVWQFYGHGREPGSREGIAPQQRRGPRQGALPPPGLPQLADGAPSACVPVLCCRAQAEGTCPTEVTGVNIFFK